MTKQETNSNKPAKILRDGAIKATIWRNEGKKDGDTYVFFTAEFSRTYTDSDKNLKDSHSFSGSEPLRLAHLAGKAYDLIGKLNRAEKALANDEGEA